jgi:hypothetical protein
MRSSWSNLRLIASRGKWSKTRGIVARTSAPVRSGFAFLKRTAVRPGGRILEHCPRNLRKGARLCAKRQPQQRKKNRHSTILAVVFKNQCCGWLSAQPRSGAVSGPCQATRKLFFPRNSVATHGRDARATSPPICGGRGLLARGGRAARCRSVAHRI